MGGDISLVDWSLLGRWGGGGKPKVSLLAKPLELQYLQKGAASRGTGVKAGGFQIRGPVRLTLSVLE